MAKGWGGSRNPAIDERLYTVIDGKRVHNMTVDTLKHIMSTHLMRALKLDAMIVRAHRLGHVEDNYLEGIYHSQNNSWKCVQTCIEELESRGMFAMYLPLAKLFHRRDG